MFVIWETAVDEKQHPVQWYLRTFQGAMRSQCFSASLVLLPVGHLVCFPNFSNLWAKNGVSFNVMFIYLS